MHDNDISKTAQARLESLCAKASSLIPEDKRDWWLAYLKTHMRHYISVLSYLPPPESCGQILEVGCIPGHLTLLLADLGYKISCVDINPDRFAQLWSAYSIKLHKVDIETERFPFEDKKFSIVLFTEVLEHLRVQPIFALREIARVTDSGGKIILSVPNITPIHRWRFFTGRDYQGDIIKEFDKLDKFGHMGHIRLYSAKEVQRLLQHVGYTEIKCRRGGSFPRRKVWIRFLPFRSYFRKNLYFTATH
jgi:SAM-dependent methyltransferase